MNDLAKENTASPSSQEVSPPRLAYFHVTFFATVMGLAGLGLATHAGEEALGVANAATSRLVLIVAIAAFCVIVVLFALKALRHPEALLEEWRHPVKMAFFPAISISLLLIAIGLLDTGPDLARWLWLLGAMGQGAVTLTVVSGWIGHRSFQPMHISPAWFIPAVGNVVVPLAGVPLGYIELSWLFFSVGLVFWIVLLTLVINRLIFHDPLPGRLLPTLVILIAPPAVAFLAWLQLVGLDPFARILLNAAYGFALIVAVQAPGFARLPFALSWWALSFPLAALTIASLRYAALSGSGWHQVIGLGLLMVLWIIVCGLVLRTVAGIVKDEICQPE